MDVQNILIDKISPSSMNPRKTFDEASLDELASNIEKQGLLQPITVRISKSEDVTNLETGEVTTFPYTYEIVCGERRFRAFLLLKAKEDKENIARIKAHRKKSERFQTISCIVRDMTDEEAFDAMITENLQRKDVDPIEEASAFSQLLEKGRTLEDIALKIGKSTRFVFDRVKLNNLIPEIQQRVRNGEIPLSGAMILSKLDIEEQTRFARDNQSQCTTEVIRRFVNTSFMVLENADWIKDNSDTWEKGEFKSCSECEFNTSNHGCLFYEMNCENARCTNPVCFQNKMFAHLLRKLDAEKENLVHEGELLDFGKTVIVDEGTQTYWSEEKKALYRKVLDAIRERGYIVVNPNEVFRSQCYYSPDDERLQNMLEHNEVYRCLSVFEYSGIEYKVKYFYVRKDRASNTTALVDLKQIEIEKINCKIKRAKEIAVEKGIESMRELIQNKDYHTRSKDLSVNEQTVFDVAVLRQCSDEFLKGLGLKKYDGDCDFMKYVQNNQADRNQWYRAFIAQLISQNDITFYKCLQKCQNAIISEQYPTEYKELGKKLANELDKKEQKLKAKLEELENSNKEEA